MSLTPFWKWRHTISLFHVLLMLTSIFHVGRRTRIKIGLMGSCGGGGGCTGLSGTQINVCFVICYLYTIKTYIYFRRNTYNCRAVWTFFKGAIHLHFKFSIMFINIINYVKMWKRSLTYEIIQFKVLTNRLLMACLRRQFEAEAPEYWHQLNQTIWPEVCITHLKACKQVLAKNNSRTKPSNLVNLHHVWHLAISNWDRRTITIWGWFWLFRKKLNHRRKLQENREY
jgi:hypothetical protein